MWFTLYSGFSSDCINLLPLQNVVYHNISGSLKEGKAITQVVKRKKRNMGKHVINLSFH